MNYMYGVIFCCVLYIEYGVKIKVGVHIKNTERKNETLSDGSSSDTQVCTKSVLKCH